MDSTQKGPAGLPVTGNLTLAYVLSLVVAVVMALASVVGLLYPTVVYPADELVQAFVPNDVVNLLIGVPILLGSLWLAWRGKLLGVLFWPGALFFVFYTYLVYVLSVPLNVAFLLHLTLVTVSGYTMIGLVARIDGQAVHNRLAGMVPEKAGGGVLAGLGILFFVRVAIVLVTALISPTPIDAADLALHVADFLITPAWVIGGVLLWQRKAFGYVVGLGLLFHASMLFIGLIAAMILQPIITATPFDLIGVLVVFAMGLICFVPFALFVRGAASKRDL